MVGRTILDLMNPTIVLEELAHRCFQENRVGLVVEDIINHEIKLSGMKIHTAKNLH